MPIQCDTPISAISTNAFRELDYRVMRDAFDSQNELGRLADERVYQADLAARLRAAGVKVCREVEVRVSHRDFQKSLFLDLVVEKQAVYELKAAQGISNAHIAQLMTYLHLAGGSRGKLVNFGSQKIESQFVNSALSSEDRHAFQINDSDWNGSDRFRELIVNLLRDWGTSLSVSLYQEAFIALLGGTERVEVMLPMSRGGVSIGSQRFYLAAPRAAFRVTAINGELYPTLHKLLN